MPRARSFAPTAAFLAASLALVGCSSNAPEAEQAEGTEPVTVQVAAVTSPMTDVVLAAGEAAEAAGDEIRIELVEVGDYVTVNRLLADGEIYANFATHAPFMEEFNAANNADLTAVQSIYNFTIAFYSKTVDSIEELPEGATIALPSDASNLGRALKMLNEEGLITLEADVDPYEATVADIADNPKNFEFLEVEISQLNNAYDEADLVFQWPSHIAALGLTPQDDGLITELDDTFALNLVVQGKDAGSATTQALIDAFTSEQVREVIEGNETIELAF